MTSLANNNSKTLHFVYDVESIGLYGESFAVAFQVFDEYQTFEKVCYACKPERAKGLAVDYQWIESNVPVLPYNASDPLHVRQLFWDKLQYWLEKGATIWAHHVWPVDSSIITACINDDLFKRRWQGPSPIHEICTIAEIALNTPWPARLKSETPAHDPRNDVAYSARVLKLSLNKLNKGNYQDSYHS
jgi:hypothetical protein